MKISETWLREWVNTELDSPALSHRLTMLGLEVDEVVPVAGKVQSIVVGKVLDIQPHPNADRLRVCAVDVGESEPLSIVCGAPNVETGASYPAALVGAELPGGMKIKRSKLRGVVSEGMLCSATELGLAETSAGILRVDNQSSSDRVSPGLDIADVLDLADVTIDIDLTPNRADCFSVLGISRDLAASENIAFQEPVISPIAAQIQDTVRIDLEAGAGCARFCGRIIRDIDATAKSPLWLQERLRRCGIRAISPVVDVTNFVMLELGQPMHAYDLRRLKGTVCARRAKTDEQLTLLDGETITLDSEVLVIGDESGAVGLAGIMGGQATAVSENTTQIFLESAWFSPAVIAGRARRFGMHTDASLRFERGVDPVHQARAIERATQLLLEITGGKPGPLIEESIDDELPRRPTINLRAQRVADLLGIEIEPEWIESSLRGLHFEVDPVPTGWQVTPPAARFDITIEPDLIEEIVRLYGYDNVPEKAGEASLHPGTASEFEMPPQRIQQTLVARGYQEVITYSFVGQEADTLFCGGGSPLALSNPISSDLGVMRRSLLPGLAGAAKRNLARQESRLRLFESGVTFDVHNDEIVEKNMVAVLACGAVEPEQWGRDFKDVDLFDIKSDLAALATLSGLPEPFSFVPAEHPALRPGRSAQVFRQGEPIGWLGELHPAVIKALDMSMPAVVFEVELPALLKSKLPAFKSISRYPAVRRDLSPVVKTDVPVDDLLKSLRDVGGNILRDIVVFDVYTGENVETGSKSVSLGLILQETSRTLTEADVNEFLRSAVDRLSRDFNATIRE